MLVLLASDGRSHVRLLGVRADSRAAAHRDIEVRRAAVGVRRQDGRRGDAHAERQAPAAAGQGPGAADVVDGVELCRARLAAGVARAARGSVGGEVDLAPEDGRVGEALLAGPREVDVPAALGGVVGIGTARDVLDGCSAAACRTASCPSQRRADLCRRP